VSHGARRPCWIVLGLLALLHLGSMLLPGWRHLVALRRSLALLELCLPVLARLPPLRHPSSPLRPLLPRPAPVPRA
jgi:hypothetical protein